ncbi:MAG: transporter substrate-binding domain-containing protein [Ruminococcaceae bacterium]|nr:transporter substrate-binding domain-containing protein [Oscillospiraceae bacterium]
MTEIDSNGSYDGYSYEYLKKVAEFANWKLEYVMYPDMSLDEQIMGAMADVESGKADLMGVMLQNDAMKETYLYPDKNYGVVYTTLDVLDTNYSLNETNYMKRSPLRVAVLPNAKTRNAELEAYVQDNGIECEYVYCSSIDEQLAALKDGRADALLKVSLTFLPNLKQIAQFAEDNGLVLSQPYIEASLTMFTNKASVAKAKSDSVLALMCDVAETINYDYKEIHYYNSVLECLNAVNNGEADYGYASTYLIDFYTSQSSHKNLTYLNLTGYNREIGFFVPNTEDTALLSIINKYVKCWR